MSTSASPPFRPSVEAVWCELLALDRVEAALPLLAELGLALQLAWRPDERDALFRVARRARELGVEVRPWLLLDRARGYWPSAANAHEYADVVRAFRADWRREVETPGAFIVDMEPPYALTLGLDGLAKGDLRAAPSVLRALRDLQARRHESRFEEATVVFRQLVDEAHAEGFRVLLTTLPFVVDDPPDGDGLARALGLVVDGVAWDRVSLQAYRTVFHGLVPSRRLAARAFSPYLIHSYAAAVGARFGERGGLDLGLVGHGVVPAPLYDSPRELQADVGAAHAGGVPARRLAVFNLEGLLERGPIEAWLAPTDGARPPRDLATNATRRVLGWAGRALRLSRRFGRAARGPSPAGRVR